MDLHNVSLNNIVILTNKTGIKKVWNKHISHLLSLQGNSSTGSRSKGDVLRAVYRLQALVRLDWSHYASKRKWCLSSELVKWKSILRAFTIQWMPITRIFN